ncbi:MAG: precorrin-3B C(17)-methyltransferase, partial [Alphaproteobacteria bacterium]
MNPAPAIVVLTPSGATLAERLRTHLPGATVHGLARRVADPDIAFDDTMAHLGALFRAGTPIAGVCASGILIRSVAPYLADKRTEPPVLALAEDGSAVVPLLGGHAGGNALARLIADALGIAAALTTAGDVTFGYALDAPPRGWRVANPETAKPVMAARLAGESVGLVVEAGDAGWLTETPTPWTVSGN